MGVPAAAMRDQIASFAARGVARYAIPLTADTTVGLAGEDPVFEEDRFAVSGPVDGLPQSRFLLVGNGDDVHGWIALRETNQAYLIQTVAGQVVSTSVPMERIFPVCKLHAPAGSPPPATETPASELVAAGEGEPFIGTYNNEDLFKLQSRPGAKKVLFLDIAGVMNGDTPKDFSKDEMYKGWQGVAAGYSSWDVNVTTDSAVYNAAGVTNSGIAKFFTGNDTANCPLGAFGSKDFCHIYTGSGAEPEKGYGVARTTTHELGHLLGMDHDGDSSSEYFPGLSAFHWCPIMGNYYMNSTAEALNQWSKGEYSGANNKEDDIAIITKKLPLRADDVPDAKSLQFVGTAVNSDVNRGQITSSSDTDTFTFKVTSAGHATLNITRIEYYGGSMLDVDATLQDSTGKQLAQVNPKAVRAAKIDVDVPVGDYKLIIKGGAEGTPAAGFSNYSSIGYYGIQGTITGGAPSDGGGGGGSSGTGGAAGTGGANGTGGVAGTGGAAGPGGRTGGSGGMTATGGSNGNSGGTTGSGGRATGGTPGSGGATSSSGGATNSGGASSGGAPGSGGAVVSSGGAVGSGGASSSGGAPGPGGAATPDAGTGHDAGAGIDDGVSGGCGTCSTGGSNPSGAGTIATVFLLLGLTLHRRRRP